MLAVVVTAAVCACLAGTALDGGPVATDPAAAQGAAERAGGRTEAAAPADVERRRLSATISRTTYGVPHIRARDITSLAFGFAYAFAEDNICTMADRYVTVSAQRSRYFGPDESWEFTGNGTVNNNLTSDFFYERINRSGVIRELVNSRPPEGPLPLVENGVRGYVAGYNHYLRETGVDNLPDPRCRGAEWVRPIRPIDVWRHFYQLGSLASSGAAIEGIGGAEPTLAPDAAAAAEAAQTSALAGLESGERGLSGFPLPSGSNAYGLGAQATDNGRGALLGNPHFPWDGAERLYQSHLTIPGRIDVAGAGLYGVPLILIGHTDGLAWSHTVATAWRFTPFELDLVPGDPHSYLVDGRAEEMKRTRVTVQALTPGGGLEERSRTLYSTRYGPMLTELAGLPFPWTATQGYALGDVNARNFRYLNHFARNNLAQSVAEYDRIQRRFQGIPWVNSIAADREGNAYYSMDGAIPNVPDSKALACAGSIGPALFKATGIPVLDGSRSSCDWDTDPDAAAPGIFGPSEIPRMFRRDYVTNGNDSHWVTNPEQPLEGFERIIGSERTERTMRTRLGVQMVEDRLAGNDSLPGRGFDRESLQEVALGNRQYAGELWRDELVDYCRSTNRGEACDVLAAWDLRDDLDSNGAILFRRFVSNLLANFPTLPDGTASPTTPGSDVIYDQPFDPDRPIETPSGLNTETPPGRQLVDQALADAVQDLEDAGIPLDAPLRGYQYEERGGERIPIHGGPGGLGVFNAINVSFDEQGYPDVPHGTSFLTAIQFTDGACPVDAGTFVTYGQSENPVSAHAADYTQAFSEKDWHDVPYCPREIRSDPNLETSREQTTILVPAEDGGGSDGGGSGGSNGDGDGPSGSGGSSDPLGAGGSGSTGGEDTGGDELVGAHAVVSGDRADPGSLPFTGLALGGALAAGIALAAAGALLRRRTRE